MHIRDWNEAMAHFLIKFEDRIQINNQVLMIEFTQLDQQTPLSSKRVGFYYGNST